MISVLYLSLSALIHESQNCKSDIWVKECRKITFFFEFVFLFVFVFVIDNLQSPMRKRDVWDAGARE